MSSLTVKIIERVLLALLFGGLVGLERELTDHPAGIRTHILVTVGACVFTVMSLFAFPGFIGGDRVAAAVVTGIGFIGGGAILRSKSGWVTGLTTAASLWSCAAIGMLCGAGFFAVAAVVTFLDLFVLELIDRLIDALAPRTKSREVPMALKGDYSEDVMRRIKDVLAANGCKPHSVTFSRSDRGERFDLSAVGKLKPGTDLEALTTSLFEVPGVSDVLWG